MLPPPALQLTVLAQVLLHQAASATTQAAAALRQAMVLLQVKAQISKAYWKACTAAQQQEGLE
jgi:hypothetical protein